MPKEKAHCPYLYRKNGKDTAHCQIQAKKGGRWDFCKYQYFCRQTNRYEVTQKAASCTLASEG